MCKANTTDGLNLFLCPEFVITRAFFAIGVAVIGTPLNILTILAIWRFERPLTTQSILVLNLCLNNVIFAGLVMPLVTIDMWVTLEGPLCVPLGGLLLLCQLNVLLAYLHITLHRYFSVLLPQSNWVTYGSPKKAAVIVFIVFIPIFSHIVLGSTGTWGLYHESPSTGTCTLARAIDGGDNLYNIISMIVFLVLPVIIMSACYAHILSFVRNKRRQIRAQQQIQPGDRSKMKKERRETRLTLIAMITVIVFVISWIPYLVAQQFRALYPIVMFNAIAGSLVYIHAITDPLIYVIGAKQLRDHLIRLVVKPRRLGPESVQLQNSVSTIPTADYRPSKSQ
jgi:hypothetical protein